MDILILFITILISMSIGYWFTKIKSNGLIMVILVIFGILHFIIGSLFMSHDIQMFKWGVFFITSVLSLVLSFFKFYTNE